MPEKKEVFLSSTFRDLNECRASVIKGIESLEAFSCDGMEKFTATPHAPLEECLRRVERCDIYVGVLASFRGGSPNGSNMSFTEHEYECARELGRPIIFFMASESFLTPISIRNSDSDHEEQEAFKEKIKNNHVVNFFSDPEELRSKVVEALSNWEYQLKSGINVNLEIGLYHVVVKGRKSIEIRTLNVSEGSPCEIHPNKGDWHIQWITVFQDDHPSPMVLDFSSGVMPEEVSFFRNSTATYKPSFLGSREIAEIDEPRFEEIKKSVYALLLEPGKANRLTDSSSPSSQGVHLLTEGAYIIWVEGEGGAEVFQAGSSLGISTCGDPFVFAVNENSNIFVKVHGELNLFQLEYGMTPTSYIETIRANDTIEWSNPTQGRPSRMTPSKNCFYIK
ncbi:DUF4062 domain-containing protein [Mariprofundus sp. EBB-1]|uniref:DUF4062 domain-containing protein n=1 Tax=Mariprofundus sp. EBB-1 TaxID=2650971 RepID=UPI000EF1EFD9|nr:DUF4062 domain-containing protein [Mariprofundus sp. EBB-1]RLL51248.1 DUF4062 domain-containing protein [Mariprofundus sp. EBB-1]